MYAECVSRCVWLSGSRFPSNVFDESVLSLYWDQIKPSETDILRRIGELYPAISSNLSLPKAGNSLVDPCVYRTSTDDSGRRVIELRSPPLWFNGWVDANNVDFTFPINVWEGLSHFVVCVSLYSGEDAGEGSKPYQFRGGRYGLAKKLQERVSGLYDLESADRCSACCQFFEDIQFYSLGRLCQLVQMGINVCLLRYEDNLLQPISACVMPSTAFACKLLPPLDLTPPSFSKLLPESLVTREISSQAELVEYLHALFVDCQIADLPLSQLKKKLIAEYRIVLNAARLGFTKLSDLLKSIDGFSIVADGNNSYIRRDLDAFTPSTSADTVAM